MRAVKQGPHLPDPLHFAGEEIKHNAVKLLRQGHKLAGAKPELKLETLEFLEEASFAKRRLPVSPVPGWRNWDMWKT